MNNPTTLLHCFDEEGDICIERFFALRRKQDNEEAKANDDEAQLPNNRVPRIRRFKKRPQPITLPNGVSYEMTPKMSTWYALYVSSPALDDHFHKLFRQRFRIPYHSFMNLSQEIKQHELFDQWNDKRDCTGSPSTPIELLLLASLRILGRDWRLDDCQEIIGVSHGTVRLFFHKFCTYGATILHNKYVETPKTIGELDACAQVYSMLGMNGCIGSMDATHVESCRIPAGLAQAHSSYKLHHPARAYNITVDHKR